MFQLGSTTSEAIRLIGHLISAATQPHVILTIALVVLIGFLAYIYAGPPLWRKMQVFRDMGVPYMSPLKARMQLEKSILLGGITTKDNLDSQQIAQYGKLFGKVDLGRSMLMVAEPELLRDIFVKEFNSFYNRREMPGGGTKLLKHALFFERDKRWREIRAVVTPTFSSAKMRNMDGLISSCLRIMQSKMEQRFVAAASAAAEKKAAEKVVVEIDAKNYFSNFAMDVIGTVFFGVGVDAITNRDHPFVKHSFDFFARSSLWRLILFVIIPLSRFRTFLTQRGIIGVRADTRNYFENIIPQMINDRRKLLQTNKSSSNRRDFLNVLLQSREKAVGNQALTATGTLDGSEQSDKIEDSAESGRSVSNGVSDKFTTALALNDDEISGQIFIFMIAGFETTATTIGFLFHELALNQDVQDRLRKEINNTIRKHDDDDDDSDATEKKSEKNELTYDSIADMQLLDACISETLRLYPPVSRLERECMQDCTLSNGLQVKKGVMIGIPTWYIQRSAENFADPEKFDPDRFYDSERRAQIKPYTYMPFGQGPRNCVGMRFALLELKMVTAFVVRNYRIVPTVKTVHPPPMQARVGNLLRPLNAVIGLEKL